MADDGLWGPCGIRLGSTEVGKAGMIHLVSLPESNAESSRKPAWSADEFGYGESC